MISIKLRVVQRRPNRFPASTCTEFRSGRPSSCWSAFDDEPSIRVRVSSATRTWHQIGSRKNRITDHHGIGKRGQNGCDIEASRGWKSFLQPESELISDEVSACEPAVGLNRRASLLLMLSTEIATASSATIATTTTITAKERNGTPLVGSSIQSAPAGPDGKSTKFSNAKLSQLWPSTRAHISACSSDSSSSSCSNIGNIGNINNNNNNNNNNNSKSSSFDAARLLSPMAATRVAACEHSCAGPLALIRRPQHGRCRATTWRSFHTSICAFASTPTNAGKRGENLLLGRHVKEALANGEPIVALESTLITHGLPEPDNFDLALKLEHIVASCSGGGFGSSPAASYKDDHDQLAQYYDQVVGQQQQQQREDIKLNRDNKTPSSAAAVVVEPRASKLMPIVTPATIGIVKGQIIVGLNHLEIAHLANKRLSKPIKASRRDVPIATALGLSAGTTVAATMAIACSLPGTPIKVFATGGTGGVHMGGESSMDISADLYEFARSPMGVVSSGFKWFLDTRRSLELLETFGCTVMSLASDNGDNSHSHNNNNNNNNHHHHNHNHNDNLQALKASKNQLFPGFFAATNQQKVKTPLLVHSVEEAAKILFHCLGASRLNEQRAALLAVPIPGEYELLDGDLEVFLAGVSEIDKRLDVEGKEKTPLILEQLNSVSGGKTLRANLELLKNNAKVGAQLALSYARLSNRTGAILGELDLGISSKDKVNQAGNLQTPAGWPTEELDVNQQATPMMSRHRHREASGDSKFGSPVVVGCTMIDMHVSTKIDEQFQSNKIHSGVTFRAWPHLTVGGVGRNLASGLQLLGHEPVFVTALARDELANFALGQLSQIGLNLEEQPAAKLKVNWWSEQDFASQPNVSQPPPPQQHHQQQQQQLQPRANSTTCFALVLIDSISGQCQYVLANLEAIKAITIETIAANSELIANSPLLVMDANLIAETMLSLTELCSKHRVPIFIEPTDLSVVPRLVDCLKSAQHKSKGKNATNPEGEREREQKNEARTGELVARDGQLFDPLLCLSPNAIELEGMLRQFEKQDAHENVRVGDQEGQNKTTSSSGEPLSLDQIESMANLIMQKYLPTLKCLLVTLDKRGVLALVRTSANCIDDVKLMQEIQTNPSGPSETILIKHFALKHLIARPISASGAGDSFASGFISGLLRNLRFLDCLDLGFEAALLALQAKDTVPVSLKKLAKVKS